VATSGAKLKLYPSPRLCVRPKSSYSARLFIVKGTAIGFDAAIHECYR